ncbi:hypothetical protein HNQ94_001592 [Salirhabdus euzebyi]|uniref:Uncharacterized protein n=1 Tax=Salirhabdus euzebyi TaxID=394506 RepID=A0A841Q421_9BACI|nr:hypothetical protein [Salirhabdus euzebyi]
MLKITEAAISKIKEDVQQLPEENRKPFIRLSMGIG